MRSEKREVAMQPMAKLLRFFSAGLLALTILIVGGSRSADAFVEGYNLIRITACVGFNNGVQDVLVIYDKTTGGALVTTDPL
jgi:hypothetical protein